MQKYLETITTYFVDPHGEAEEGGITKEVTEGEEADQQWAESQLIENKDKEFCADSGEWLGSDDYQGSEDGYNSTYTMSTLKPITDEEAIRFEKIIRDYDTIK